MKKQSSIRKKLIFTFFILFLIIISVIFFIIRFSVRNNSISVFYTNVGRELVHIENNISLFFRNSENVLKILSNHSSVRSVDSSIHNYALDKHNIKVSDISKTPLEKELIVLFKMVFRGFSDYAEVYMGTKWGGFATSFDGDISAGYDPRVRPWYKAAKEGGGKTVILKPYLSTIGSVVVCLSRSVYGLESKKFIGNVGIEVTLDSLSDNCS